MKHKRCQSQRGPACGNTCDAPSPACIHASASQRPSPAAAVPALCCEVLVAAALTQPGWRAKACRTGCRCARTARATRTRVGAEHASRSLCSRKAISTCRALTRLSSRTLKPASSFPRSRARRWAPTVRATCRIRGASASAGAGRLRGTSTLAHARLFASTALSAGQPRLQRGTTDACASCWVRGRHEQDGY